MTLTEEQRKRIEKNRKRALEIKRKKQLEQQQQQQQLQKVENHINDESSMSMSPAKSIFDAGGFIGKSASSHSKKRRLNNDGGAYNNGSNGQEKMACSNSDTTASLKRGMNNNNDIESDNISLEEFEQNASQYISQTEAQRLYCIPKGTLDVCSYIEKDNPHKRGWSKMKLYYRNDVRTRAYKRFGGKEGLIAEREKRRKKRSDKDLEAVKNVFR